MAHSADRIVDDDRWQEILAVVRRRRDHDHDRIRKMIDVRDRYNGDWVVPIPEVDDHDELPLPVPQLLANAVDQTALRAGSLMPSIEVAAVTGPGIDQPTADEYASIRRRKLYATWHYSGLRIGIYRALRHYAAYGSMAFSVEPDFVNRRANIRIANPLGVYPEPREPEDFREPRDVGTVYGRSAGWLKAQYPDAAAHLDRHASGGEEMWDVLEWVDADEIIVGLIGPRWRTVRTRDGDIAPETAIPLRRWPNRAGMTTMAIPQRVTLDKVMGQVATAVPSYDLWAKMMTLDVVAAERAIFQDMYVASEEEGVEPRIVNASGRWEPGVSGDINRIAGANTVGTLHNGPGPLAQPVIDRLQAAVGSNAGHMPIMEGETAHSLRTGRAIDSLADIAIDPRMQEIHTVVEHTAPTLNEQVFAVEEGYWPRRQFWVFSGWKADRGVVRYTPEQHFQSDRGGRSNTVSYPVAGADMVQTNMILLGLTAGGLMSRHTASVKHPLVDDGETEAQRRYSETVADAVAMGSASQITSGTIPLRDAIELGRDMQRGTSMFDAVAEAQRRAEERAQQAQEQMAEGGQPPGPEASLQPAAEGEQARGQAMRETAMGTASVPETPTSSERLRQLMMALRSQRG